MRILYVGFIAILCCAVVSCGGTGQVPSTSGNSNAGDVPGSDTSFSVSILPVGSSSPVKISATANSPRPLTSWAFYVDSVAVFRKDTSAESISQAISMSKGTHELLVRAWDENGAQASAKSTVNIIESTGTSNESISLIPRPPSSAKTWSNVDELKGWTGCTVCANGTAATFWFKQGVSNPSLDGNAMQAYIKGDYKLWADDLFVYRFGDQRWANHILWSISFQWNAPKTKQPNGRYVVQAIEFDSLFLDDGFKYMFGSQCSYGSGYWDVWNNTDRYWQHTSVACHKWAPGSWHTVTWYLERDPVKKYLHYAVLQVDGTQYKIDKWMPAVGVAPNHDFKVQWEQDTDLYGDEWYMWVDKLKVTIW